MDLVVQFIVAVFATIAFAVLFSVPKKELAFCGFTGALGWIIYSRSEEHTSELQSRI